MKPMNKITQEKISSAVIKACEDEGLMYKEAAKVFNTEPLYFTYLKNQKYWDTIPQRVWDKYSAWMYSGKKLKEYKMPEPGNEVNDDLAISNKAQHPATPAESFTAEEIQQNKEANETMTEQIKEKFAEKQEPKIRVKPEALARRKKELAGNKLKLKAIPVPEKPKRKYTKRQIREEDVKAEKEKYNQLLAAHIKEVEQSRPIAPAQSYMKAQFTPELTELVITDWLKISPERQMIDQFSIQTIADKFMVPEFMVREGIEKQIKEDAKLAAHMAKVVLGKEVQTDITGQDIVDAVDKTLTDENASLKSEIKTLAHLLKEEHEDNERLRAEVGYLNAVIKHKDESNNPLNVDKLCKDNKYLREEIEEQRKEKERLRKDNEFFEYHVKTKDKEINELENRIRQYQRRTFWDYLFNRPLE